MKKVVFFFLLSLTAFSQSAESLKATTKKFYQANYLMDFDGIIALSYSKLVETIGSDKMLKNIEKQYENDEFRLRFQVETVPFLYGKIKKIEGKSFCVIICSNPIRYTFNDKLTKDGADRKVGWIMDITGTIEATFEPNRNSFNVKRITTFVAVMDETTRNQWRFFNFDDANQLAVFQTIFGESTKKELAL